MIVILASGRADRNALKAGVAQIKSPIRDARSTTTFSGGSGRRARRLGRKGWVAEDIEKSYSPPASQSEAGGEIKNSGGATGESTGRVAGDHLGEKVQGMGVDGTLSIEYC